MEGGGGLKEVTPASVSREGPGGGGAGRGRAGAAALLVIFKDLPDPGTSSLWAAGSLADGRRPARPPGWGRHCARSQLACL